VYVSEFSPGEKTMLVVTSVSSFVLAVSLVASIVLKMKKPSVKQEEFASEVYE
jgi:hypothetical protein